MITNVSTISSWTAFFQYLRLDGHLGKSHQMPLQAQWCCGLRHGPIWDFAGPNICVSQTIPTSHDPHPGNMASWHILWNSSWDSIWVTFCPAFYLPKKNSTWHQSNTRHCWAKSGEVTLCKSLPLLYTIYIYINIYTYIYISSAPFCSLSSINFNILSGSPPCIYCGILDGMCSDVLPGIPCDFYFVE